EEVANMDRSRFFGPKPARRALPLALLAALVVPSAAPLARGADTSLAYPPARKGDVADDYHGTQVADPYRWLEALDAPDTKQWIEAQNTLTFGYLEKGAEREAIRKRLTELWNYPRTSIPVREAGLLFYRRNTGLQKQSPLFVRRSAADEPRLVL